MNWPNSLVMSLNFFWIQWTISLWFSFGGQRIWQWKTSPFALFVQMTVAKMLHSASSFRRISRIFSGIFFVFQVEINYKNNLQYLYKKFFSPLILRFALHKASGKGWKILIGSLNFIQSQFLKSSKDLIQVS